MTSVELDARRRKRQAVITKCSPEAQDKPWYRLGSMLLHLYDRYASMARYVDANFSAITDMTILNYQNSPKEMDKIVAKIESLGWRLVGVASNKGGIIVGGDQIVYLTQKPDTLECLVSFQGTDSVKDVFADVVAAKAAFCGLVDPDEKCGLTKKCTVRHKGGSFVHMGFRDHLMRMAKDRSWQTNIRPKLGKCSKLNVAGHSLGGAVAEYFAVCVNRRPAKNSYGWEHFKHMRWLQGTPELMPKWE